MDEEQFILRLPPELAKRMRLALSSKAKRDAAGPPSNFGITFTDARNATFSLDDQQYPATLMDLPCVAETHKFTEKRTFYKSGDIGQVLVVRMPGEPAPETTMMPDGFTPGSKGAAHRFAVPEPVFSPEQVSSVENTIKCIIDNKLAFVRKKSESEIAALAAVDEQGAHGVSGAASANKPPIPPGPSKAQDEEIEIVIEQSEPTNTSSGSNTVERGQSEKQLQQSKASEQAEKVEAIGGASASSPGSFAGEPVGTPSMAGLYTPQPSPAPADVEEDGDSDDFENELADLMMSEEQADLKKRRVAHADLTKRIEAKKAQIAEQQAQADRAPNVVLKQRLMKRKGELETELAGLEEELAKTE